MTITQIINLKNKNVSENTNSESWGNYGDFQLVGHGKQTNANCGRFVSFKGCLHTELHNKTTLNGVNYKGKVYVRKVHASCDKPTCPVCYKSGWAVREADRITQRIRAASKTAGVAEHIIVSIPKSDYGLEFEEASIKSCKNPKLSRCHRRCSDFSRLQIPLLRCLQQWHPKYEGLVLEPSFSLHRLYPQWLCSMSSLPKI